MQKLIHLALTLAFVLPLSATVLTPPTVTSSSPGFQGIYVGSNAVGQGLSEFLSEQGTNTFLEFDFGSARTVDGFVNVTLNLAQRSIGANRLIFDTDGTMGFNAATDTVVNFTQAQTGAQGQAFINRFRPVTAQRVRWEVQAVVGSPSLVGTTEISFLSTSGATAPITGVTVIGSATEFSPQFARANAANGIAGIGNVAGVEYASLGLGANAYVDFDLGSARAITGFDMFDRLFDAEQAQSFDLIFSNNANMSSPVATRSYNKAGSWTASDNFAPITARYVRYDITSGSGNTGLSDMQFYASEFPGANLGVITSGTPREVTFTVTGKTGVVNDVTLDWTFSPAQGQAHEAYVELIAPDNTLCDVFRSHVVDNSDIAGPYVFNDAYTALLSNGVVSTSDAGAVPAGNYRPEYQNVARSFRTTFGGKAANGVWKLRVQDILATGFAPTISSANLSIRTVPAPPAVTLCSPNASLPGGGGTLTITGTGFSGSPSVSIGGTAATNVNVVNATTITCTLPAGSTGVKNVVVTNENGSGTGTGLFRYTDLVVTSSADSGAGTLREALVDAQTIAGANTITFASGLSGQTITLTTTPIVVGSGFVTDDTGGVTLDASSLANGLTLTTNLTNTRIFYARTGSLTLRNLTIANAGGAMPGGGIFSSAALTLERCTLNNNSAAGQEGGAIYNFSSATLVQCTLTGNVAGNGAGIHNNGTLTVRHCTIAGNTANVGGGIFMQTGMTLENSIVAGNTANFGPDIYNNGPTLTRAGANIILNLHTNSGLTGSGSIIASDPLLGTFGVHGGPTRTFPLLAGSPAINAAVGSSITSDQRGSPVVGTPDIGAFEAPQSAPSLNSPTSAAITFTTATLGGNVSNNGGAALSERGIVYALTSANGNPVISGSSVTKVVASGTGTGAFTVAVSGLTSGSAYSFKAYATNASGTAYTATGTFNTPVLPPEVAITPVTAQSYGIQRMGVASAPRTFTVNNEGNGVLTITSVTTTGGNAGDFSVSTAGMLNSVPGLGSTSFTVSFNPSATGDRSTTLRIINNDSDEGTINIALSGIGTDVDPPSITLGAASAVAATTATLAGNVTADGGGGLTERGVVFSLTSVNPSPFIGGPSVTKVIAPGLNTGLFSSNVTGLVGGSAYTFRAYAMNAGGTSHSSASGSFTTLSNNADLNALAVSTGAVSPAFSSAGTSYTVNVPNSTTSLTVTPTRADVKSTIEVRINTAAFASVTSGSASASLPLNVGANPVQVKVTAEDSTVKTYVVTVNRAPSSTATLVNLAISTGTLSPSFGINTLAYAVSVPNTTSSLTVTPTVTQADATVSINGSSVTSGQASGAFALEVGANLLSVQVTAQDTTTVRTYAITVTRADFPNSAPSFNLPSPTASVLGSVWAARLNDTNRDWTGVALSADAQRIVACVNGGSLWTSADGGITWTERLSAGQRGWAGVCSSTDGTRLAAIASPGKIWTSTDSGATWLERAASVTGDWAAIACSADGMRLVASNHSTGGVTYTSTNQGLAWTARTSLRSRFQASSADGNRLASVVTGGSLETSSNAGAAWTTNNNSLSHPNVRDIAMSADGMKIYVATLEGEIGNQHAILYVSEDGGVSLSTVYFEADIGLRSVTCSADGNRVAVMDDLGFVHHSINNSWSTTPMKPTGAPTRIRSSADGTRLVVAGAGMIQTTFAATASAQIALTGDAQRSVAGFASSISPGSRASESTQSVTFEVTNTNNDLFSVQPAIAADGTLTYTPSSGLTGVATVSVVARDSGGTANGGVDASTARTFTITVNAGPNVNLSALAISTGTLAPSFAAGITDYTATIPSGTTSLTVTPTLADTANRVAVNGSLVTSGSASPALPMRYGANNVTVQVTAPGGIRERSYFIVVTRTPVVPILAATPSVGTLSAQQATLGGRLLDAGGSPVTERGVVFATTSQNANPEVGGANVTKVIISGPDEFSSLISSLTPETAYSFKAYAVSAIGTGYSSVGTFTTPEITLPIVQTVSPIAALTSGGGTIALTGRYFSGATSLTIDGVAVTALTVVNDGALTATIPAGSLGRKNIVLTTAIGSSTVRDNFRYVDLVVSSANSSGPGTLREKLLDAADVGGHNTITFAPALSGGSIGLVPVIESGTGTGNDNGYIIDDTGGVTVDATALANGLTLTRADANSRCRAFYVRTGSLTVRGLTLANCGGSQVPGGAIYSSGNLFLERCTLSRNVGNLGGALFNDHGASMTLVQCTLGLNNAEVGGAIYNAGPLLLRHCTVAGNTAFIEGGGLYLASAATLENSIVAGNAASAGIDIFNDTHNVIRVGFNLVPALQKPSGVSGAGNLSSVDPQLSGLASNGGSTQTFALQPGSPAVNAAVGSSITTDQRGQAVQITADVGAFELPATAPLLGQNSATDVGSTMAKLNGVVTSSGGAAITQRGFVYALTSVNAFPIIGGGGVTPQTASGTNEGPMSVNLTGLTPGASYTYRSYAINGQGARYSLSSSFSTLSNNANLSALTLSAGSLAPDFTPGTTNYTASVPGTNATVVLTATTAQASAKVKVNNTDTTNAITLPLQVGLNNITILVTAQDGTTTRTYNLALTRSANLPELDRPVRSNFTANSALIAGNITKEGGAVITARGIVYALASNTTPPAIGGSGVTQVPATSIIGSGFSASLTGLSPSTSYLLRTYATNSSGTGYSEASTFTTTAANADLSAIAASSGSLSPAFAAGTTTYSLSTAATTITFTPSVADAAARVSINNSPVGSGTPSRVLRLEAGVNAFTFLVSAADGSTTKTYTVNVNRAAGPPILAATPTSTAILSTTATLGGDVTKDNGSGLTERGVVYALTTANANPEIGGGGVTKVIAGGTAIGVFTANVTGLTAATGYSYKAYAINAAGTSYSSPTTFATGTGTPNVAPNFTMPSQTVLPPGLTWTAVTTPVAFSTFDVADDGQKLIAGGYGKMHTSTNGGTSWTQRTFSHTTSNSPGGWDYSWNSVTLSNDGLRMLGATAGGNFGYTAVSADSGANFAFAINGPKNYLAMSDDGAKAYAADYAQYDEVIRSSTNGGVNWAVTSAPKREWTAIATSQDGSSIIASAAAQRLPTNLPAAIFLSTDSGTSWPDVGSSLGSQRWSGVAISGNGSVLYAVADGGGIHVSRNAGKNWISRVTSPGRLWSSITCSKDGRFAAAAVSGGKVWTSSDTGETWTEQTTAETASWNDLGVSADGRTLYAMNYNLASRLWKSEGSSEPYTIRVFPGAGALTYPGHCTAISAGANERNQTLTFLVTTDNNSLFRVLPAISTTGTLTFAPSTLTGTANITVRLQDNGGTAGGGVDTSPIQTFRIVNRADDSIGTWSTAPWTGDASSGIIAGRTHWARRFGSGIATTVNGVSVSGISTAAASTPQFDLGGASQVYPGDSNNLTSGSDGSAAIAQNFIYSGFPLTLKLKGLAKNEDYVLSLLTVGWDATGERVLHFGSGSNVLEVDQSQFGNNGGLRIDYNFTANALERVITVAPANGTNASFHLYGIVLRAGGSVVNTAPTAITLSSTAITENNAPGSFVGTLGTTDPESGQSHTYEFASGTGDANNDSFLINGSSLSTLIRTDRERKNTYSIRIRSTDNGFPPLSTERAITLSVLDMDEPVTDLVLNPALIEEGNLPNAIVAQIDRVGDPENNSRFIRLIGGAGSEDNQLFSIDTQGKLYATPSFDFETKKLYKIRLQVSSDDRYLTTLFEKAITIGILDVNDAPTITTTAEVSINEDTTSADIPVTLADADSDLTKLTLTATSSNPILLPVSAITFGGSGAARSIRMAPLANQYGSTVVKLTVSDGIAISERSLTLNVGPVDDTPTFDLPAELTVNPGTAPYSFDRFATGISAGPNEPSAGRAFLFSTTMDSAGASLLRQPPWIDGPSVTSFWGTLNYSPLGRDVRGQTVITVTMREFFGGNEVNRAERSFTLKFQPNWSPSDIVASSTTMDENIPLGQVVATLSTVDRDLPSQNHRYAIDIRSDGIGSIARPWGTLTSPFKLVGNQLLINESLDFERQTAYTIYVRSTDSGTPEASLLKGFTFTVNNLNETPSDFTLRNDVPLPSKVFTLPANTIRYPENQGPDAILGTFNTTDADAGQTFTYTLLPGQADNALFTIEGNQLKELDSFNFEQQATRSLRVRVTDSGTPARTLDKTFTLQLIDLNDAPTDIQVPTLTVNEGTYIPGGSFLDGTLPRLGILTATDEDPGSLFYFNVVRPGDDSQFMTVFGSLSRSQLYFLPNYSSSENYGKVVLDYESPKRSYTINLRAEDTGVNFTGPTRSFTKKFTINVLPVDEPTLLNNVKFVQRPGAKLVDINFDLQDPDTTPLNVVVQGSNDNGASWSLPLNTYTDRRHVGASVSGSIRPVRKVPMDDSVLLPVDTRTVTWNAGVDWNNNQTDNGLIRVTVGSQTVMAPAKDAIDTRGDGPLMITGRVINKLTGDPWTGVSLKIGTRSATSDARGNFTIRNAAPGVLTASVINFYPLEIDVVAPQRGQSVALRDLALTPDGEPPVVQYLLMTRADGIVVNSFGIKSPVFANINWNNNGDNQNPQRFRIVTKINGVEFRTETGIFPTRYTSPEIDYDRTFLPGQVNRISVQVTNNLGLVSKEEVLPIRVLGLPKLIEKFAPRGGKKIYSDTQLGFDFGVVDLEYSVKLPKPIGKWGIQFGSSGSFDYTIPDANWELAYRGGDLNLFGQQFKKTKIYSRPDYEDFDEEDEDRPRIVLFLGEGEREIAIFVRAQGNATMESGFGLPAVQGAIIHKSSGPIAQVNLAQVLGIPKPFAKWLSPELTLDLELDLGGSATFKPTYSDLLMRDVYKLSDATFTGGVDVRATLSIGGSFAGAEGYVGAAGKGRFGYPSPLLRELNLELYAGYEVWVGFLEKKGRFTLASYDYQSAKDPALNPKITSQAAMQKLVHLSPEIPEASSPSQMNLGLKPLYVKNSSHGSIGPMNRRWRDDGGESFLLAHVAAPSARKQAQLRNAGQALPTSIKPLATEAIDLHHFNRMAAPISAQAMSQPNHGPLIIPSDPGLPAQVTLPLLENVYPKARSVMAEKDGNLMLLYVRDTGAANPYHFTEVNYCYYNGTSWTTPGPVASDPRGQTDPQICFDGNGNAVATWQRLKNLTWDGTGEIAGQSAQMEIISAKWDASTGAWSAPMELTNNNVLDHQSVLAGPLDDGDLLLTWLRNNDNEYSGNEARPDALFQARWDAATSTWGPATQVIDNLAGITSLHMDARGSKAVVAYTADADGNRDDATDTEVWHLTWQNGVWGAPVRATTDQNIDSYLRIVLSPTGQVYPMWMRGKDIVMDTNFSGSPTTVRADNAESSVGDFALTLGANGQLLAIWQSQVEGRSDAYFRTYDVPTSTWSLDSRLSDDDDQEKFFVPIWDSAGNLVVAYLNTQLRIGQGTIEKEDGTTQVIEGVIFPGRTDLHVARRRLIADLTVKAESLTASASTWGPGSQVTLSATLLNSGNRAVSNASLSFYDGNPSTGGSLIGTVTAPGSFKGDDEYVCSLVWTVPADPEVLHTVYAVADTNNALPEFDESNNRLSLQVGGPDLKLEYLHGSVIADGSVRLNVRVTNIGSPISKICQLNLWDSPVRSGAPLASLTVSALDAFASVELPLTLPVGAITTGERSFEIIVNEDALEAEPNQGNNRTLVTIGREALPSSVTGLSDLAVAGATLSPQFTTSTTSYATEVPTTQESVTVVPTAVHFASSIQVNGVTVGSGEASAPIILNEGSTRIVIDVTSENGTHSMTYTVDVHRSISTLADSGQGSLRDLVNAAAFRGGPDMIRLPRSLDGQSLTLSSPIVVNDPDGLIIDGSALENGITITGTGTHRLFEVTAGSKLTLICVTLTNGQTAIYNEGTLEAQRSTFTANTGINGAAITNTSTGTLTAVQCTFAGNEASAAGGAIFNQGTASFIFSTIAANSAGTTGGGIRSSGNLTVENSIIAGNSAAPGSDLDASGTAGVSSLTFRGSNIVPIRVNAGISPGGLTPLTIDPLLAELARYGGPTATMPPGAGSAAIDQALSFVEMPTVDQRGYPRVLGLQADIGAVEGRVLIVTTAQDELDAVGVIGTGYSLREALRDAEDESTVLFDRAIFHGGTASTNVITLTRGPINPQLNVRLDATQNPGGVTIVSSISITAQPTARSVAVGSATTFTVAATQPSGGIAWQWRKDGANIPLANQASFTVPNAQEDDEGVYEAVLTETAKGELTLVNTTYTLAQVTCQPASLIVGTSNMRILAQPAGALIRLGGSHALTVVAVGNTPAPLTYQWKLAGKVVAKATGSSLILTNAALNMAGAYTCEVKQAGVTLTTVPVEVVVVDTAPKTVNLVAGGTFNAALMAAGNNLTYVWKRGETVLSFTTAKFMLKPLTAADMGLYTCTVANESGSIIGFNTQLNIITSAPTLGTISLPTAFIGQSYYYQLPVLPRAGAPATGFSVSGALPAGIKLNTTTGVLSGRPTVTKEGGYALIFNATNGRLRSAPRSATLTVVKIDPSVIGVYAGPAPRSPLNGNLGGRFDLTTTITGTFSGSVTLGSRAPIRFTNILMHVNGANDQILKGTIPGITMLDKTPLAALVEVFVADQTARLTLTHPNGTQLVIPAWRNPWSRTALATAYATNYTLRLDAGQGDETSPDGYGFASFSIGADGIVKLSGKLPDGNAVTAGGFVGARGQVLVFQTLYKNAGSLVGQFNITRAVPVTTNSLVGALTWSKPRVTTDLLYKDGFASIAVQVEGSAYVRPAAGQRLLGLPATSDNALLDFRLGGLSASWSQLISIANPSPTGLTNTASVPLAAANGLKVVRLDPTRGSFTGNFTLAGATAALNRLAPFEGLVVKIDDITRGYGFFLLPKVPVGAEKVTTAPRLSGVVELGAP